METQHTMQKDLSVLFWPVVGTVVLLSFLVWLVWKLRAWWREDANDAETEHEILARYREMNLRGELSDEEYRSIKSQMAARLGMAPVVPRPVKNVRSQVTGAAPAATADVSQGDPPSADKLQG